MFTFYCTKKLEKFIGKPLIADPQLDVSLEGWNANYFNVNRKKYIMAMHDQTCYVVLVPNILKRDLKSFSSLFANRLRDQLVFDGIPISETLNQALLDDREIQFMPTNNNRRILGTMTQFVKDLDWFDFDETVICEVNHRLTNNWVSALGDKRYDFDRPIDMMRKYLEEGESFLL